MYWNDFKVNGNPFTVTSDGLIITGHPQVDQAYKDNLGLAIELSDALMLFVRYMHRNLLKIECLEDAIEFFGRVPNLGDFEGYAAFVKAMGKIHDIELPADLYWMVEGAYSLFYNPPEPVQASVTTAKKTVERDRFGYVYLIRSSSGYFKIGRTVNPENRIKTFGVKLPFEVSYEHVIPCNDHITAERDLHERFADKRVNGEWFNLEPQDIAMIKAIASM